MGLPTRRRDDVHDAQECDTDGNHGSGFEDLDFFAPMPGATSRKTTARSRKKKATSRKKTATHKKSFCLMVFVRAR